MEQYLQVGKIINTHGIKGEVKVLPLTDDPERYNVLKTVFIDKSGKIETLNIETVKYFKGFVILKFKEVNDMDGAQALKECLLLIDRKNAIKLRKGSFFICDIIGIEVFDIDGNKLGVLNEVLKTGSNDVYVVSGGGSEILIPALKTVVKEVDIEGKKMVVELPEGLI